MSAAAAAASATDMAVDQLAGQVAAMSATPGSDGRVAAKAELGVTISVPAVDPATAFKPGDMGQSFYDDLVGKKIPGPLIHFMAGRNILSAEDFPN